MVCPWESRSCWVEFLRFLLRGYPMLAKINLRTACGCTKVFFERVSWVYPGYRVPISATCIPAREPGVTPRESWSIRNFELVNWHWLSKHRVELWYEEVYLG